MKNTIEEFYYGNVDPQARSFEQSKSVQQDTLEYIYDLLGKILSLYDAQSNPIETKDIINAY